MISEQQSRYNDSILAQSPTLKRVASMNAYKHGLTAKALLIHELDRPAYLETVATVFNQYHPATAMEQLVVQEIADTTWKLDRVSFYEAGLFAKGRLDNKNLIGPDVVCSPEERHMLVEGVIQHTYSNSLANLSLQQGRSQRHLERKIAQFEKLRSEREPLALAEANIAMRSVKGDPKDTRPADRTVGPVFTIQYLAERMQFIRGAGDKNVLLFDRHWGDPRAKVAP